MRTRFILSAAALLALTAVPARGEYIFSTKFNSGRVPAIMSVEDRDQLPVQKGDYRNGFTTDGWTVVMVSGGQYAAVSPSHTRTSEAQSNLLSCPARTISGERPMLRWKGRSIHPSFPEAYRVLVQETGAAEPVVVYETQEESDTWRTHAVDLSQFIGKEVVVSWECVSVNKYLLAIDDVYIGDPEETEYHAVIESPRYVGMSYSKMPVTDGKTHVNGRLENLGMPLTGGRLVIASTDGEEYDAMPVEQALLCGDSLEFDFEIPVKLDEYTHYIISVEDASGAKTQVTENDVFCSNFTRTLLMDEYTGTWCTSCPRGMLEIEKMEREYGDQLIVLTLHVNDDLECAEYREGTSVFSVPWMKLNRNNDVAGETASRFESEFAVPTEAYIEVSNYSIEGDRLQAEVNAVWSKDVDNSADRYRVGYVLKHDVVDEMPVQSRTQNNGLGTVASDRFYYLNSSILSDLSPNYNVVVTGEFAHEGRPYSLPSKLSAMETVTAEIGINKPEAIEALKDATLVAYIVDTQNGHVLNACAQRLDREVTSIVLPGDDAPAQVDGQAEYFTLDGIRVHTPTKGIYIERRGSKVRKIVK